MIRSRWFLGFVVASVFALTSLTAVSEAQALQLLGYPCSVSHKVDSAGLETAAITLRTEQYCGGAVAGEAFFHYKSGSTLGNGYYSKDAFYFHMNKIMDNSWRQLRVWTNTSSITGGKAVQFDYLLQ